MYGPVLGTAEAAGTVSSKTSADFDMGIALRYVVRKGICSVKNHASRLIL